MPKGDFVMESGIFSLIHKEQVRQDSTINLIASENYAPADILALTGSVLTNKYAEGYPGKRYYGGCSVIDEVETHAVTLGKKLFQAEHINVQPHSGSTANMAVYFSVLHPGDTILGMNLNAGGHLTHGHKINFSGMLYNVIGYGVCGDTGLIDYNQVENLAIQHKPKLIIAGASAYSRLIDYDRFEKIARACGALLLVDMAHIAGPIAAGIIPSPVIHADFVSSTTHKTLRGPRGGIVCCKAPYAQKLDKAVMPGLQGGPLMHVIAAKARAFELALDPAFVAYQKQVLVNAQVMADAFRQLGYFIVSGGTDTHLFLIDFAKSTVHSELTGCEVEEVLGQCSIIVNRNSVPFDTRSPLITSGIRIGTPAVTTRGFGRQEVFDLVVLIDDILKKRHDMTYFAKAKERVLLLCKKFPIQMGS